MKKAKVVVNEAGKKGSRMTGKKVALLAVGAAAALGVVSVTVPASNIPGFKYIAQVIGINADSTRNLTMSDFASYAIGSKNNKIQELRAANTYSYGGGIGAAAGGLSPFSTFTTDRLAQAYEENSKSAIEIEKSLGGKISPFDKNAVNKEVLFDADMMAKGFDPAKLTGKSKEAHAGAMESLAAAAGKQVEAFGNPLKKNDLSSVASIVGGTPESNISNIVGAGNIASIAKKEDMLYERMQREARALTGTSIFGSVNPEFSRKDTSIGRPVYGIFKDLGNAFFFSRYAKAAKLPTAASDIAAAAFNGGSPQDQSIVTKDDNAQQGGSVNPNMELNQSADSVNMCKQATQAYKELIATTMEFISVTLETMYTLTQAEQVKTDIGVPGTCRYKNASKKNKRAASARNKWNHFLSKSGNTREMLGETPDVDETLVAQCENLMNARREFAGMCGITFDSPQYSCEEMGKKLRLGEGHKNMLGMCRNVAAFGNDVSISKRKIRRYKNLVKELIEAEFPYGEDGDYYAEELASIIIFDSSDIESNGAFVCGDIYACMNYVAETLEKTFSIDNFDLRGFLLGLEPFKDNYLRLQQLDIAFLKQCQKVGNMDECQSIMDYYTDDVLEEQCPIESFSSSECEYLWETLRGIRTRY